MEWQQALPRGVQHCGSAGPHAPLLSAQLEPAQLCVCPYMYTLELSVPSPVLSGLLGLLCCQRGHQHHSVFQVHRFGRAAPFSAQLEPSQLFVSLNQLQVPVHSFLCGSNPNRHSCGIADESTQVTLATLAPRQLNTSLYSCAFVPKSTHIGIWMYMVAWMVISREISAP